MEAMMSDRLRNRFILPHDRSEDPADADVVYSFGRRMG